VSTPRLTWVIGAGGLLGQHVRAAAARPFDGPHLPWSAPRGTNSALRQGIRDLLSSSADGLWDIAWCAGAGVVASSADQFEVEQTVFRRFLDDLTEIAGPDSRGAVFFASSAGGVYAGSAGPPFTEASAPSPRSAYGAAKLVMEADLRRFAEATRTPSLIGRIANLYGPGQNLAKAQGLVSHLCRTHLTGQPLFLYVPLDTMRDYIYVEDAAAAIVAGLGGLRTRTELEGGGCVVTKIFASGHSTTVAGLLGESTRLFRRRPRVVLGSSPAAAGQVHDLRLRSTRWPELDRLARTALPIGLAATAADIARRLREGSAVPLARGHQH
jgi:UDP-glucose 4-epimerase